MQRHTRRLKSRSNRSLATGFLHPGEMDELRRKKCQPHQGVTTARTSVTWLGILFTPDKMTTDRSYRGLAERIKTQVVTDLKDESRITSEV